MSNFDTPNKQIRNDPVVLAFIGGGVIVGVLALWYFGHDAIVKAYWNLRAIEFWLPYKMESIVDLPGLSSVKLWLDTNCAPGTVLCRREDWSAITWKELSHSSVLANIAFASILLVVCVRALLYANTNHPIIRFAPRKVPTLKSFMEMNAELYAHLCMFNRLNLIDASIDDPLLGMSQTSRQYVFANHLIGGWVEEADGTLTPTLDRERTTQVFRTQLGQIWTPRASGLTPGETLLLAIAMPRVAATDSTMDDETFQAAMKESENIIQWCWKQFVPPAKAKAGDLSWLSPDIALDYPQSIIRKYIKHTAVQALIVKHAYVRTMLYAMTCEARRLGVLPPAEVRWLRFFDRQLWYVFQNISSRTAAFAEGAAVVSHYLSEVKSGEAIVEPQLDRAIEALSDGMRAFRYGAEDKAQYEAGLASAAAKNPKSEETAVSGEGVGKTKEILKNEI